MSYKIATGVLAFAATGAQFSTAKFANKMSKRAAKRRRKITNLENRASREAFMREYFATQASALSQSVALGLDSSAGMVEQQNIGSLGSQAYADVLTKTTLDREAYNFEQQAAKARQRSDRAGGIAKVLGGL